MTPHFFTARNRISWYEGDGSERCVVCRVRDPGQSYYVGQIRMLNDEGRFEKFPVCSEEHGLMWMEKVWQNAIYSQEPEPEYAF